MEISIELGALLTAATAMVAGYAGLTQYRKAEAWKRAEFTGSLLEQLSTNEELAFACRSLDWGLGPLVVPGKYRVLYSDGRPTIAHDWEKLVNALRPSININVVSDTDQLVYRYCFDAMFDYLDRLRIFVTLDLVQLEDLKSLKYYVELIRNPRYYSGPIPKDQIIGAFVSTFYPQLSDFLRDIELAPRSVSKSN